MRPKSATLPLGASLLAAALCATPAAVSAEEAMRVGDLGLVPSQKTCLEAADKVLSAYIAEFGGHATSGDPAEPKEWAIYGWALRPGTNDVVITCPSVVGNTNAFYTVHASGEAAADDADTVAERLRKLWDEHN
jgi:hypothetical protein